MKTQHVTLLLGGTGEGQTEFSVGTIAKRRSYRFGGQYVFEHSDQLLGIFEVSPEEVLEAVDIRA